MSVWVCVLSQKPEGEGRRLRRTAEIRKMKRTGGGAESGGRRIDDNGGIRGGGAGWEGVM